MNIATEIGDLRNLRSSLQNPLGLVPTMGYLHEGHLSLMRKALEECANVAVSIFVNPTQFSPSEDLDAYPRDLDRDLALIRSEGVELVWTPTNEVMYGPQFQTWIEVERLTKLLEGAQRPEHFRGVTTVVAKLFNVVQPQRAYFGQKDAQQAVVVRRMTEDLDFPIDVVICPTVRESDGLALSSRNSYLNPNERIAATVLYRALSTAKSAFERGTREADVLRANMRQVIENEPLAEIEYISAADPETLEELDGQVTQALLSMAVRIGKIRLIDNARVGDQRLENKYPVVS